MELRELAAFRAVATTGSVTKAASLLHYVQSSVTAQVQSLEADLERGWDNAKGTSRMAWAEAKGAVRDAWHGVERVLPGDADRDGR